MHADRGLARRDFWRCAYHDGLLAESPKRPDLITRWYLAAVALCGLIYVSFAWTPSSYGFVLDMLEANGTGPAAGTSQFVRSDEWGIETPYFQAAVRNRFRRVNETSFYGEDLRNFYALPLADWSLVFKPQLWAFFVLPPAIAYSLYWALMMCGFLAGYQLLFRELGADSWLAATVAVMLFFSGFVQFWWTTYSPLLAGLPWILLVIPRPMPAWKKALWVAWACPALVLAHVYPTLLMTLAWGSLFLLAAFGGRDTVERTADRLKPVTQERHRLKSVVRALAGFSAGGREQAKTAAAQPGRPQKTMGCPTIVQNQILPVAAGVLAAAVVVYSYYAELIPIMRNTVYPGHRVSPAGETPALVALSQLFPFLTIRLHDYQNLTGMNICEIGAVGTFLPLLTLCVTRYRALRECAAAKRALAILLSGFAAVTIYELAPLPAWVGRVLLWNTGITNRWLFTSGLMLLLASLVIWRHRLISPHPMRFTLFVLIGPLASIMLKPEGLFEHPDEMVLYGLISVAGLAAWYLPTPARTPVVVIAMALTNVYAFGRFNPLQSAKPIFGPPDSKVMRLLREEATATPGGILIEPRMPYATANGLGFRSVSHTLMGPEMAVFRRYFPAMDERKFNFIFNRFATISLTARPMPAAAGDLVIEVPMEAFVPVRNVRRVVLGAASKDCSQPAAGGIDGVSSDGNTLTIEGWAPWMAETDAQGIRVLSGHALGESSLTTVTRADIAEKLQDYRMSKSGFKLRISSADGKPLRTVEVALIAFGTAQGEVRLACR
jgi:hypothetical protein